MHLNFVSGSPGIPSTQKALGSTPPEILETGSSTKPVTSMVRPLYLVSNASLSFFRSSAQALAVTTKVFGFSPTFGAGDLSFPASLVGPPPPPPPQPRRTVRAKKHENPIAGFQEFMVSS